MKLLNKFLSLFVIKDEFYSLETALNRVLYNVSHDPWIFKYSMIEKLDCITRLKFMDIPGIEKLNNALSEFIRIDVCDYIGCNRFNSFKFIDKMDLIEKCDIAIMILEDMED